MSHVCFENKLFLPKIHKSLPKITTSTEDPSQKNEASANAVTISLLFLFLALSQILRKQGFHMNSNRRGITFIEVSEVTEGVWISHQLGFWGSGLDLQRIG